MPMHPLADTLQCALRDAAAPAVCVAFSGGPDSTALLHALAQLPEARERGLRALHIDHGLHPDSAGWGKHCGDFCKTLGVPLATLRVEVDDNCGEGIEAAARHVRRAAFAGHLRDGEWLTLAHHRDDQVETVLLKLLRGAGPEGLGGMRALRPFARGFLWRPLLETPREILRNYLIVHGIDSIDDPANRDPRFTRNTLRGDLLPMIRQHWPSADASILHAAQICRAAADYIDETTRNAVARLRREADTLDAKGWLALADALRAPVLDAWLHARGLSAPPDAARAELQRQTARAAEDRVPLIAWPGAEVRLWDHRLHAMPPLASPPRGWQATWSGAPLVLPPDCGTLALAAADCQSRQSASAHFDAPLTVRFRHGGERIKPIDDTHTRELRDLFQRARIPPWLRNRCPLIYDEGELIAVADLWISERGQRAFAAACSEPRWLRPGIRQAMREP